jgi:hypothetical protein
MNIRGSLDVVAPTQPKTIAYTLERTREVLKCGLYKDVDDQLDRVRNDVLHKVKKKSKIL